MKNLKSLKLIFLLVLNFSLLNCAKDFSNEPLVVNQPKNIIKIKGKFAAYISPSNLNLIKNFSSDDCESWAVDLKLDDPYKQAVTKLLKSMFENIEILDQVLSKNKIEKNQYASQINIFHNDALASFVVEENIGKFKINLQSKVNIIAANKEIENKIYSDNNWQKSVYLNCNLNEGARKTARITLEKLIHQMHSSIFESVYTVTR